MESDVCGYDCESWKGTAIRERISATIFVRLYKTNDFQSDSIRKRQNSKTERRKRSCFGILVVYLDADTLVLQNVDVLFDCPGFCATLRHSERMNSGVMVVTPSETTFKDMLSKIDSTESYTGHVSKHFLSFCAFSEGIKDF